MLDKKSLGIEIVAAVRLLPVAQSLNQPLLIFGRGEKISLGGPHRIHKVHTGSSADKHDFKVLFLFAETDLPEASFFSFDAEGDHTGFLFIIQTLYARSSNA